MDIDQKGNTALQNEPNLLASHNSKRKFLKGKTQKSSKEVFSSDPLPALRSSHQIKDLCNFNENKIELLEQQIKRNKRFLGMVIHDMRNPTVAIKLGLENIQLNLVDAL